MLGRQKGSFGVSYCIEFFSGFSLHFEVRWFGQGKRPNETDGCSKLASPRWLSISLLGATCYYKDGIPQATERERKAAEVNLCAPWLWENRIVQISLMYGGTLRFLWSRPWLFWQTQFYILDLKIVHSGDFGRLSPQIFALVQVGIFWQKHGQQEVCCAVISSDLLHSKFSRGNFSISSIWYGTSVVRI